MKRNVYLIALHNFLIDFRLFAPIAVLYFSKVSGSYALGMSVFSAVFLSSALFEIPTGIMSDRIGRKWTLVLGTVAILVGVIIYASAQNYLVLVVGAVFEGFSRALYSGNNNALLHDTLEQLGQKEAYHRFLGKVSSLFQIASAIAAIIGGFLASYSFVLVMWLSVVPQIINVITCLFITEPKTLNKKSGNILKDIPKAFKHLNRNKKIRRLGIARMIDLGLGNASFEFQVAFYQLLWPTWALGIARTISNFAGAASYWISGALIDKFKALKILTAESLIVPSIKVLAVLVPNPASPAMMASGSLLYGSASVSGESLLQKEYNNRQRATLGSLISFGGSLINALASVTIGFLADQWGIVIALVIAQIGLMSLSLLYLSIRKL